MLLADLGHKVPTSVLPSFLTRLGAPTAAVELIEGIADGLAGAARLAGGTLADDPERCRALGTCLAPRRLPLGGGLEVVTLTLGTAPTSAPDVTTDCS